MEIEEIALSGGYIFAIAFLGALHEIDRNKVRRYIGTSAGAIVSFLLVLGFEPLQLARLFGNLPLERCIALRSTDVLSFLDEFGVVSTERLIRILAVFCKHVGVDPTVTFSELFSTHPIDLAIIAYCVSDQRSVECNHRTTPDMPVLRALEMSIAIPVLFKPVIYEGKLYVDGSVLDKLPWRFVKNRERALGLVVRQLPHEKKINVFEFVSQIIIKMMDELDNRTLAADSERICVIHVPNYSTDWLLNCHRAEVDGYLARGKETIIQFLHQRKESSKSDRKDAKATDMSHMAEAR